ncbi:hypothetical protein HZS80_12015 [Halomonas glaciei]|uniref:Uncharacterized protein n=1 Tax=Vreelandella glaciei TaxID=186761 RepID=A0A7Z0RZ29_9GAMM|nr:hypothetical protein [Halomonas glaciei]NYS78423.1 hypothetical protein [Halomonas glaciei]
MANAITLNPVSEFLESLRYWKENIVELEKYKDFESIELKKICDFQFRRDVDGILDIWKEKLNNEHFELCHPEYPEVITRAVYNIRHRMANFVFMIDVDNKHPWIFAQCEGFIDYVITQRVRCVASPCTIKPITDHIDKLWELVKGSIAYKDIAYGFDLTQTRPYHYFYDHLKYFLSFIEMQGANEFKRVALDDGSFYKIKCSKITDSSSVLLFSSAISANSTKERYANNTSRNLSEKMEKFIYQDAMENFRHSSVESDVFKIWYGITGQKRSWLQQVEAAGQITKNLSQHFPKIELLVDGMTARDGEVISNEGDEAVFRRIQEAVGAVCEVKSLIGMDYRSKIQACSSVDVFVANAGSGSLVPLRFCDKPGVLHSNSKLFNFRERCPHSVKIFDKTYEIDEPDDLSSRSDFCSYHIPWQHIYNLLGDVIFEAKGIFIDPLSIPPVEEVRNEYWGAGNTPSDLKEFQRLNKFVVDEKKIPLALRALAIAFDKTGDLVTAEKIMEKAHLLRPNGAVIKKDLDDYRKRMISQENDV